jgi:hypothetical protein
MLPPPRHGMARRQPGRDRQEKHDGWTDPGAHYVFLSILLKRGRSQLTEEGIVRPTAIMADTRLKGVSIGGTSATYAPSACGGRGLLRQHHITSITVAQPLHGRGRQAALPQPQAPGRSPNTRAKPHRARQGYAGDIREIGYQCFGL